MINIVLWYSGGKWSHLCYCLATWLPYPASSLVFLGLVHSQKSLWCKINLLFYLFYLFIFFSLDFFGLVHSQKSWWCKINLLFYHFYNAPPAKRANSLWFIIINFGNRWWKSREERNLKKYCNNGYVGGKSLHWEQTVINFHSRPSPILISTPFTIRSQKNKAAEAHCFNQPLFVCRQLSLFKLLKLN